MVKKTADLDITRLDVEFLEDIIKKYPNDKDAPIVRLAEIVLKLARKAY